MGNFLVRYASRVVIYDRRAVLRLATEVSGSNPVIGKLFTVNCIEKTNINKKEAKLKKVLSKLLVVQFSEFCHNSCPKTYRETVKGVKDGKDGWEPWSSVYGSRLTIQRLWVRISAPNTTWIFSHLFALILFEKTENKMKKRPGNRYIRRMSTY